MARTLHRSPAEKIGVKPDDDAALASNAGNRFTLAVALADIASEVAVCFYLQSVNFVSSKSFRRSLDSPPVPGGKLSTTNSESFNSTLSNKA